MIPSLFHEEPADPRRQYSVHKRVCANRENETKLYAASINWSRDIENNVKIKYDSKFIYSYV